MIYYVVLLLITSYPGCSRSKSNYVYKNSHTCITTIIDPILPGIGTSKFHKIMSVPDTTIYYAVLLLITSYPGCSGSSYAYSHMCITTITDPVLPGIGKSRFHKIMSVPDIKIYYAVLLLITSYPECSRSKYVHRTTPICV